MDEAKTESPRLKKYVPPKGWDEITTDEKVERVREIVKRLQSELYSTKNITRRLREIIVTHKHIDGKVVEEVKQYESGVLGSCEENLLSSEKPYF